MERRPLVLNLIPADSQHKSGIYIIRNSVNGKVYVGSASRFSKRFRAHKTSLIRGSHHSPLLQRFVNKYGMEALRFELLALCDVASLIEQEQVFIDSRRSHEIEHGFNCCPVAGSSLGVKQSAETRAKVSAAQTPERRLKQSIRAKAWRATPEQKAKNAAASKGHLHTAETKAKISLVQKGRQFSEEHRARLVAANTGRITSAETKAKLAETSKKAWATRREKAASSFPFSAKQC